MDEQSRIHVTQAVLHKAGAVGLPAVLEEGETLAGLLAFMALNSAKASGKGGRNPNRRRFGHFVLMVRDNKILDLIPERGDWCRQCLGARVNHLGSAINCNCD